MERAICFPIVSQLLVKVASGLPLVRHLIVLEISMSRWVMAHRPAVAGIIATRYCAFLQHCNCWMVSPLRIGRRRIMMTQISVLLALFSCQMGWFLLRASRAVV